MATGGRDRLTGPIRAAGCWLAAYVADPDPRTALANFVAVLVATSQPTFPLYVYWSVSPVVWPTFLTFLSTPFFLAVPAVSRWDRRAGRALLPIVGVANTVVCAKAFGVGSGVEAFLLPCVALPLLVFRPGEWRIAFPLAGAALATLLLHNRYGAPLHAYSESELAAFARLNLGTAGTLTAVLAYRVSRLIDDRRGSDRSSATA